MRLRFAIVVVIGLWTSRSYAIAPPSPEMRSVIQADLVSVNSIHAQVQELDKQISDKRNGPEQVRKLNEARKVIVRQRDLKYNVVVRQTLIAYGLVSVDADLKPRMPSGKSVYPNFSDRRISWLVVYKDDAPRTTLGNNGTAVVIAPGGDRNGGGVTYADGVSTIYGKFSTVEDLAVLLRHEQIHFEQLTTRGVGNRISKNEAERDAREKLISEIDNFGLSREAAEAAKQKMRGEIAKLGAKIEEEKSIIGRLRRIGRPEESFVLEAHAKPEYADIARQGNEFDEMLAAGGRKAAEKARQDRKDAERDHDNRLRAALIDIIARSCVNPGSVSQDELDNLPKPNDPNFYCEIREGLCSAPDGVGVCGIAYLNLGFTVGRGGRLDADALREATAPRPPIEVAKPVTPQTPPVTVVAEEPYPLWYALHDLKALAVNACRSGGEARIDPQLTHPTVPYSFDRGIEDFRAGQLSAGLGECERQLFMRLIEMIRNRQEGGISQQWLRDRVGEYSPRNIPPPAGDDPCRDNRNIRCP